MSEAQLETVLAGSKDFALALFVPVMEKMGNRPRVATDAAQALSLVESHEGLVIVEVSSEKSVRSIEELLRGRADLKVVAAVNGAFTHAESALVALGAEYARFDGTPAEVLGAIGRRLGNAPPPSKAMPEIAPAEVKGAVQPLVPRQATVAKASLPSPAGAGFFSEPLPLDARDEISIDEISIEDLAPTPPPGGGGTLYVPPQPVAAALPWPAGGIGYAEAENALTSGLNGKFRGESRLRTVVEGVIGTLSALEFAVVSGDEVALDPRPVRRAALMRLRVASALADRPPEGSAVDQGALSTLLGEIDALLSEVSALAQGAPADLLPSLEAVRNSLVKEAIDFSEAAQQIAKAEQIPDLSRAVLQARRARSTRVLNVSDEPDVMTKRSRTLIALLVVAVVGGGSYHGWRYFNLHRRPVAQPFVAGAPAHAIGMANAQGSKFLTSKDGKPFTDGEIEVFRQQEEIQGRKVLVLSPTNMVSVPAKAAAAAGEKAFAKGGSQAPSTSNALTQPAKLGARP